MKKSLVALAALAVVGAASAQSSITLYGRIDAGVGRSTTEATGAVPVASQSQTLVTSSALNTTYWGMKGSEDLGGGLKANFDLQSQFSMDTGAAANTMFERLATVGLSGSFGAVNLGRQYTAYDSLRGATNNIEDTNVATTGTVWKTGMADYSNRISNSIRYDSLNYSGVSGGVALGLGENQNIGAANLGDATNNVSLHVKYAAGPLLVGYAYQNEKLVQPLVTTPQVSNKYNLIGASYDFGVAKLTGSYNRATNDTITDKEYQVGVTVPFGAAAVMAGYSHSSSSSTAAGATDLDGRGYTLAGIYSLSKRTTLYAGYFNTSVETGTLNAITTTKGSTFATGVRHTF